MNLSQLYYFQKLAELQHYTHAAEELFISQPTLSHAIAGLEEDLGCKLFRKQGRNVRLTEDGVLFKAYVDQSLGVLEDGVAALKLRQGRLSGNVQIGAIATVRADYLPSLLKSYRMVRGEFVKLLIEQGSTQELVEDLIEGKLDMAFASKVDDPRLKFTKLFTQSLGVIVHRNHPLANSASIGLRDLKGKKVFTYRSDIPIGARLDDFLRDNGIDLTEMWLNRDSDDEVMLGGLVSQEAGIGLVLLTSGLLPHRDLKVIPLQEKAARDIYTIGILRLADARLNPAARDFLAYAERFPMVSQMLPEE